MLHATPQPPAPPDSGPTPDQGPDLAPRDAYGRVLPTAPAGSQAATPGLINWMAGTGNEPLFGDGSPGDPTGGQGPVAAVGDTFAVQTDTPGPQGVTPGLTDWMAGTGNEPLFGDGSPGDPTGGQGPVAAVGDTFAVQTDAPGPPRGDSPG